MTPELRAARHTALRRRCAEPSRAGRWSSPNRLNQLWQQCGPVGYSAPATVPNYRPLRDESNGTGGIFSTGPAQKAPFIKPSTLWTILVCPRSYPHALTLDLVDDRSFDRVWSHAGIGRRWHFGLSHRLMLPRQIAPAVTLRSPLVSPGVAGCDGPVDRRKRMGADLSPAGRPNGPPLGRRWGRTAGRQPGVSLEVATDNQGTVRGPQNFSGPD
jgi:hypothetical protein